MSNSSFISSFSLYKLIDQELAHLIHTNGTACYTRSTFVFTCVQQPKLHLDWNLCHDNWSWQHFTPHTQQEEEQWHESLPSCPLSKWILGEPFENGRTAFFLRKGVTSTILLREETPTLEWEACSMQETSNPITHTHRQTRLRINLRRQ